jgi:hypothetical protein
MPPDSRDIEAMPLCSAAPVPNAWSGQLAMGVGPALCILLAVVPLSVFLAQRHVWPVPCMGSALLGED